MNEHSSEGEDDKNLDRIESEIDRTRDVISEDLGALGEKLSPENIKEEAKEQVKQAAVEAKDAAMEKLRDAKDAAKQKIRDTTNAVADTTRGFVRENAVPLALIGMGAAWLVMRNRRRSRDAWTSPRREVRGYADYEVVSRARDRTRELGERTRHAVTDGAVRARDLAERGLSRVRDTSRELADSNPIALGVVALAAGVGVGLLIPSTEPENRLMGNTRDRLLTGARETMHEVGEAARDVGRTARDTARDLTGATGEHPSIH
jgi:hypothetical protein